MKNLKILLALSVLLTVHNAFAQNDTHLKLSDQYPTAGEKIKISYDPAGTVLDAKKGIEATVYYLDDKDYPAADVDLHSDGRSLTGELSIPLAAKAFLIKISADDQIDDNNEKGYVYIVYKDKKPVQGAYASQASLLSNGMANYLSKIKPGANESIDLYKKEFNLYPQSEKEYQANYYFIIARKPEYKDNVNKKIIALELSTDEKDNMLAANLLQYTKNTKGADSLNAIIKSKFPSGEFAKNELGNSLYRENDPVKKDSLLKVLVKKFPETMKDEKVMDRINIRIAMAYLQKEDMIGYEKFKSQVKDKSLMAMALNNVAWEWADAGKHVDVAEKLSKESVDMITAKIDNPDSSPYTSPKQAIKEMQGNYNASADTYAYILWKENKSAEALPYMKKVYDRTSNEVNSTEHYALILAGVGQYEKAIDVISKGIKSGQSSTVLKEELKKDYLKVKGSDTGYDKYLASLEGESKNKVMADLAKTMINQPAPTFTLKDLDGKAVSLNDLKGKIVIVDFWATWCGPCKASFPGMQMAVNKYKDDPNVKFLFVDCWENGDKYVDGVKKFIAENKYTFHVLIDEKGDDGRQAKVVSSYNVEGIPTKFIIDKSGNIRFKFVGFSGTPEKLVDEVTNMVDMAANPDAVASADAQRGAKSK